MKPVVLTGLFALCAAQQFSKINAPNEGYQPQIQSIRPIASSGNVRNEYGQPHPYPQPHQPHQPSFPAPQPGYPEYPQQPQPPQQPDGYGVEEVDSVDLFPSGPQQPETPFGVVQPPEFGVVQPPVWTQRPEPQPAPYVPHTTPAPGETTTEKLGYEINYCDKKEFPDEILAQYGLERIEYFIWNNTCSQVFFQCSIGATFMLKCPSEAEAFDRSTVNCNFRNSVKVCPEYDHVMHCTIKDQCVQDEFACCALPQKCLPLTKRCDGHNDCSDGEDENNCPSCQRDEFACVKSGRCIPANLRCDGNPDDCQDGTNMDEVGCSRNTTCVGKFMCHTSIDGPSCIDYTMHCDGQKDCYNGEDETNCKHSEAKYILCENQKQQVLRSQWCNGEADCADGSDEKYCY